MARQLTISSDWLYRDPVEPDDLDRGEFTQDEYGVYLLSAQNRDGLYWAPRTKFTQLSSTKPTDKDTWPPYDAEYNFEGGFGGTANDFIDTGQALVIRTINTDTSTRPSGTVVTGAIGDVVCRVKATIVAANQRSSKGILLPTPDAIIDGVGAAGSQKTGKTWRVRLAKTDPDGNHNGQSRLNDGQYYHISVSSYLP